MVHDGARHSACQHCSVGYNNNTEKTLRRIQGAGSVVHV